VYQRVGGNRLPLNFRGVEGFTVRCAPFEVVKVIEGVKMKTHVKINIDNAILEYDFEGSTKEFERFSNMMPRLRVESKETKSSK
jgi:hypothetical protein